MQLMRSGEKPGDEETSAVIQVGKGRGFVVEGRSLRLIITAASCLPRAPEYSDILGDLGQFLTLVGPVGKRPSIQAQLFFADPISDIALLGPPSNPSLYDFLEEYKAMVDESIPLKTSGVSVLDGGLELEEAWVLSPAGQWFECVVEYYADDDLWLKEANARSQRRMPGSPILAIDGSAIGVVSAGSPLCEASERDYYLGSDGIGREPRLDLNLPGWALREFGLLRSNVTPQRP